MRAKNKLTLTELFIKKTKLAAGPYYDAKERGLLLLVQGSGRRSFYFMYNVRRRGTRWYNIGWISLADARRRAIDLRAEVANGKDPQAEKLAQRDAKSFGDLHQRYLTEWAQRRNKSWRQADYLVRKHLLPRFGRLDAKSVTRADVRAAIGKIASPTVANQTLEAASAIFTFGVKMEVVAFNPCKGIDRNKTHSRERVLSDSEIKLFWPELTPPLKVILLTGQRPGEVKHMLHLHIKDGWWEMPGKPEAKWPGTKNGESRRVWLSEPVREIVAATVTNVTVDSASTEPNASVGGFVFKRSHPDAVMRDICERLGVEPKITPHDLRRTFATRVAALGFGRQALDRILNHRDRGVTNSVYNRYEYAIEDQRVMEAVARHIIDLAEGRRDTGDVIHFPDLIKKS